MGFRFVSESRMLISMLNAIIQQAETDENCGDNYVASAYPHMVKQFGVVLTELGKFKLIVENGNPC